MRMEPINLFPVSHRGAEQILIQCDTLKILNDTIRKLPHAKWSKTYKSWYLPLNKENYDLICQSLSKVGKIDSEELRKYLLKKKL